MLKKQRFFRKLLIIRRRDLQYRRRYFLFGVCAVLSNHWTLMLDYKGNFTSDYRSNTGLISAEFKF